MNPREELKLKENADIEVSVKKRPQQFQDYLNLPVLERALAVFPHPAAVQVIPVVPAVPEALEADLQAAVEQTVDGRQPVEIIKVY